MAARLLRGSSEFSTCFKRRLVNTATLALTEPFLKCDLPLQSEPQPVKVSALSNGVKVAAREVLESPYSRVSVYIRCGSRVEDYHQQGLTHLLKHCAFLSNQKKTSFLLRREIEQLGATLSCSTTREHVIYSVNFLRGDEKSVIESLCDAIVSPSFRHYEVEEQREYVLFDIFKADSNPESAVFEGLHKYGFRNGLCNSLYSPSFNVDKLTESDLMEFVNKWYIGNNITVAGVGIDHDLLKECSKPLSSLSETGTTTINKAAYVGGNELRIDSLSSLAQVAIVCKGTNLYGASESIAGVVQCLLGNGQHIKWGSGSASARLSKAAATKVDSPFTVNAINIRYHDNGLFGFYAVSDGSVMGQVLAQAMKEFSQISNGNIEEADLARAKNQYKAELLMNLEKHGVSDIGEQVSLTGSYADINDKLKYIDTITAQDAIGFVKTVFSTRPTLVCHGNLSTVPRLDQLLTNMS